MSLDVAPNVSSSYHTYHGSSTISTPVGGNEGKKGPLRPPRCPIYKLPSFFFLFGVQLIYNVVLVSGVQQSESVIHLSTLFRFLSCIGHYRALSRFPCVIK